MKPILLTMQAFGSYGRKTTIDFRTPNQNLFLITGDTGAGKTTIFDAIVFALYGEASSGSNKKDGIELQSQFTDYQTPPFVELTFSEHSQGEPQIYTVRRVPRHIRPLKKGSGVKDEAEAVCLTMPDGQEYAQNKKETNAKLEEIIGLTKNQFMQVAMIAQGEFMELLRADSNKKREIFRKLFNTELFRDIVNELEQRRKAMLSQLEQLRTSCQTEIAHIHIPPECPQAEELSAVKDRILNSTERLNAADLDLLLDGLKDLCTHQAAQVHDTAEALKKASAERDRARDACQKGENLLAVFRQLEDAQAELARCDAAEADMQAAADLVQQIDAAYEIQSVYQRFADAKRAAEETEEKRNIQRNLLPSLRDAAENTIQAELAAKAAQDTQLETFTRVSQRVDAALEVLEKISQASRALQAAQATLQAALAEESRAKKALMELEAAQAQWRRQSNELADAGILLAQWESQYQQAQTAQADMENLLKLQQDAASQTQKLRKAQEAYGIIRQKFISRNEEYLRKQTDFLDAQAGFLAKEKLAPGKPCPVCGSTHHPKPCTLADTHRELTRETIEQLAQAVEALRQEQSAAASAAGSAADLLKEKQLHWEEAAAKLRGQLAKFIPDISENQTPDQMKTALVQWCQALTIQGEVLKENAEALKRVQELLIGADEKKQALRTASEAASLSVSQARLELTAKQTTLDGLETQKDYPTEQEARAALRQAETAKKAAEEAFLAAHSAAGHASSAKAHAEALIAQFEELLPGQQEDLLRRQAAYTAVLSEKGLSQAQWQQLTACHRKSEISLLQEQIHRHTTEKAKAAGAQDAARKAIGSQEKPNPEQLLSDFQAAETAQTQTRQHLEALRERYNTNLGVYNSLAPKTEERSRITKAFSKLDSLYTRLAGKVTGGRMDIETFVQRCHLQRILCAANVRFQDMSAGQFELRICSAEQAGDGKNRGLDLMVYSTVTGKEREVRTLSGGESFMAALSLALGMADQIQENSAAIHLDMMFIDEGFGSLDSHSRDQAVRVLQQMASGSKLIGIISHVTELKQAIDDQLVVTKDEAGSHPVWKIS